MTTSHRTAMIKRPTTDQPHFTVTCGNCQAEIEAPLSEEGVEQAQAFLRKHPAASTPSLGLAAALARLLLALVFGGPQAK